MPDGYDKGRYVFTVHTAVRPGLMTWMYRDNFVKMAVGVTSFNGTQYNTTAQTLTGVLPAGSNGINHGMIEVFNRFATLHLRRMAPTGIAIDGNAVLLTVTVV